MATPFRVKAVYEYTSPHEDDLNFPVGQIITVNEQEDDEFDLEEDRVDVELDFNDFCLVGRFLTDKSFNFNALKNQLAGLWRPVKGVNVKELSDRRYLFKFYHVLDLKRVLDGCLGYMKDSFCCYTIYSRGKHLQR